MNKKIRKAFLVIAGVVLLISISTHDVLSASSTPQKGGILRIGNRWEPPVLNCMMNPSIHVFSYASQVFNGLVMIDPTQ